MNGTSGASAIIAGAAIIVQSIAIKNWPGKRKDPKTIRAYMSQTEIGTPQSMTVLGNIGVMPDLRALIRCYNPSSSHTPYLDSSVEPAIPPATILSGVATMTAPLCNTPKEYRWELIRTPMIAVCKASSRACIIPRFNWRVNGIEINNDMVIEPQVVVSMYDMAESPPNPNKLKQEILPVRIGCTLSRDRTKLELMPPLKFLGRFELTIVVSADDSDVTARETVEFNAEALFIDWGKDSKNCLDDTIHYLDHRIVVADKRLELVKSLVEPSRDYAHVFTELRQIMAVIQKSVTDPLVAQEIKTAITKMLNITPKQLDAFLPE